MPNILRDGFNYEEEISELEVEMLSLKKYIERASTSGDVIFWRASSLHHSRLAAAELVRMRKTKSGVYVRVKTANGRWTQCDVLDLTEESFRLFTLQTFARASGTKILPIEFATDFMKDELR